MSDLAGAVVLAHGGGVPEVLSVAVPVLLLGAILYAGRRRERAEREAEAASESATTADAAAEPAADAPDDDVSR
ncbi:MAG TPA: hypothetical protein VNA14_14050 [Mycobacteriales bacterium]|nr:hypothetical protein [Mycobacteriales bacterium]